MKWRRPNEDEMAGYFERYVSQVPESDPVEVLKMLKTDTRDMMLSLSLDQWDHRYADGKWTIKEVWVHVMDTERIFAYRALRFGRADETPLPGFEQDDYILPSRANDRTIAGIIQEYEAVRNASITLFENLPAEALDRTGKAANNVISVRAFAFLIAGHERHHIKGLKDYYGVKV